MILLQPVRGYAAIVSLLFTSSPASGVVLQDMTCAQGEPVEQTAKIPSASRSERRQAVAILVEWPHRRLPPDEEARTEFVKKEVVRQLRQAFFSDSLLKSVLLSFLSARDVHDDPLLSAAATSAYAYLGLPEDELLAVANSRISPVQRHVLFSALRAEEEKTKTVGRTRAVLVCRLAHNVIEGDDPDEFSIEQLRNMVTYLHREANNGSLAAQALLSDSLITLAERRIRTPSR